MAKLRYEETIMREVLLRDLQKVFNVNKDQLWSEASLPLKGFAPANKTCRIDVAGAKERIAFIIETKLSTYPQNIGVALGQVLVYLSLLRHSEGWFSGREKVPIQGTVVPFICFNAFDNRWSQWGDTEDTLVNDFNMNIRGPKVGVLLLRARPNADLNNPDHLSITCRISPTGLLTERLDTARCL